MRLGICGDTLEDVPALGVHSREKSAEHAILEAHRILERTRLVHDLANMVQSSNKAKDNRVLQPLGRARF
jgi:hypothetical protein